MQNDKTETGNFDKFFGILKSDKSVSVEEMANAGKERVKTRFGALPDIKIPDNFDDIELPEFKESEIFPKF